MRVLNRARLIILSEIAEANEPRAWYLKLLQKIEGLLPVSKDSPVPYSFADNPVLGAGTIRH